MAIFTRSTAASSEPSTDKPAVLRPEWAEHVVTAVSASIAVLVVATIAVLMGMA